MQPATMDTSNKLTIRRIKKKKIIITKHILPNIKLNNQFLPADGNRLTQKKETWVLSNAKKGRPSTRTRIDTPTP